VLGASLLTGYSETELGPWFYLLPALVPVLGVLIVFILKKRVNPDAEASLVPEVLKRRKIYIFGFFITLFLTITMVSHFLITQSDPYIFAKEFLTKNRSVRDQIGEVKSCGLSFLGSSIKYINAHGIAELRMTLKGERDATVDVYLSLIKTASIWEVKSGSLLLPNGTTMPIILKN
jgi:hypothetical protein